MATAGAPCPGRFCVGGNSPTNGDVLEVDTAEPDAFAPAASRANLPTFRGR
jgi:hypothetical protein